MSRDFCATLEALSAAAVGECSPLIAASSAGQDVRLLRRKVRRAPVVAWGPGICWRCGCRCGLTRRRNCRRGTLWRRFVGNALVTFGVLAMPADDRAHPLVDAAQRVDGVGRDVVGKAQRCQFDEAVPGGLGDVVELAVHGAAKAADALKLELQRAGKFVRVRRAHGRRRRRRGRKRCDALLRFAAVHTVRELLDEPP